MAIYLIESDVEHLADMELALAAVESSLVRQGQGRSSNVGRRRAQIKSGALNLMGAADESLGVAGVKVYSTFQGGNARFVVLLFDILARTSPRPLLREVSNSSKSTAQAHWLKSTTNLAGCCRVNYFQTGPATQGSPLTTRGLGGL